MIEDKFLVQTFQHDEIDTSQETRAFPTMDEALEFCRDWAIPYDNNTEHEVVIFEAVKVVRFPMRMAVHDIAQKIAPRRTNK